MWCAQIFRVKTDHVDADLDWFLLQKPADFQHHCNTASSIVGSKDRRAMVLFVWVVVCPRSAVPMTTKQNSVGIARIDVCYDVSSRLFCAVPNGDVGKLFLNFGTQFFETPH